MKRFQFLTGFLCGALLFCVFPTVASAASNIMATISNQAIYVDGQRVSLTAYQIDYHIFPSMSTAFDKIPSIFSVLAFRFPPLSRTSGMRADLRSLM